MNPDDANIDFLWWKHGVLYQVYPRSFADSDSDGIGDLRGLTGKLDYLQNLGIDGIWLSPIYPSPMDDFGYDISDYRHIDPLFGSMDDFIEMVEAAHARGIRVIMDMVFNHTSDRHPWFVESRQSGDNEKRDWYIWHPGQVGLRGRRRVPNNWRGAFGGSAWSLDPVTGEFYLHSFLPQQPDLNWRNPDVRSELHSILRYWMDLGVDGFRFDVINYIVKDELLRSNPYRIHRALPRRYEQQNHLYDRTRSESHAYLKELRSVLDEYPEIMSVGEIFPNEGVIDQRATASYLGNGVDELHMAFDFSPNFASFDAGEFSCLLKRQYDAIPESGWPVHVLSNHDQSRAATRLAKGHPGKMKILLAMLLTQRGTPFLYYGDEIGMEDGPIPRSRLQDPVGLKYWPFHPGRDPARTPMQWDASDSAGFTQGDPWLPIPDSAMTVNVAAQKAKADSILSHTRALIAMRRVRRSITHGDWRLISTPKDVLGYRRQDGDEVTEVYLNFSPHVRKVPALAGVLAKTGMDLILGEDPASRSSGSLAPYGWAVVGN